MLPATRSIVLLALLHGCVDLICITAILWSSGVPGLSPETAFARVCDYNLLAFSGQAVFGLLIDLWGIHRGALFLGCFLVMLGGAGIPSFPTVGMAGLGAGNALFHVGAGGIVLGLAPGKAAGVGLFVAPGALGVFVGTLLAQAGFYPRFLPCLMLLVLPFLCSSRFAEPSSRGEPPEFPDVWAWIGIALLLAAISIRSFLGLHVPLVWKKDVIMAAILTGAIFGGKALGGYLADRIGWNRLTVWALSGAGILLVFGREFPIPGIAGMFLFNMVMPVTLAGVARMNPMFPGFSFGLTCLALNIGMLSLPDNLIAVQDQRFFFPGLCILAAALILSGLRIPDGVAAGDPAASPATEECRI